LRAERSLAGQSTPPSSGVLVEQPTAAAFNRDAAKLAVADLAGHVTLLETAGKKVIYLISSEPFPVNALAWSPDSRLVAVGTRDGSVQLWRAEPSMVLHQWPAFSAEVTAMQFSPDGRWLLAGSRQDSTLWDVATGEELIAGPGGAPWGFSNDGRWLAAAGIKGAMFCELVVPRALVHLRGHLSKVVQIAWSKDNRHLVSFDKSFDVRVWDAHAGLALDAFRAPPGDFYAENAAIALSDDGRLMAYASGGMKSTVLIRDISKHVQLGAWELPKGCEKLISIGPRQFLLVREERTSEDAQALRTVVRELKPGHPPDITRILRPARNGDEAGFFKAGLTPDGRYHFWMGPRRPHENCRVEVREVATGDMRLVVPAETSNENDGNAHLSSDGRYLIVNGESDVFWDVQEGTTSSSPPSRGLWPCSADTRWRLVYDRGEWPAHSGWLLSEVSGGRSQICLRGLDAGHPEAMTFSFDSRYLACADQGGTITLVDLPALQHVLSKSDASLLPQQIFQK